MRRRLLAAACLLALPALAEGPAPAPTPEPQAQGEEEIVVTGTRTEQRLADTPVATEVITRSEIESSGAEDLAGVLEEHPGIEISRSSFTGSNFGASIRIQGLDAQYVLVLVNGERATGRTGGAIDLTRFRAEDIEKIEIVRGSSSALYGSDALGGVVNVITRRPAKSGVAAEGHATYGTLGALNASATGGLELGAWSGQVSAGWHRADSFDLEPADVATSGSGFNELNAAGRFEYRRGPSMKVVGHLDYLYRDTVGVDATPTGGVFDRLNRTETFSVSLGPEIEIGELARLRVTGHYSLFRDQFLLDQRGSDALDQYSDTREQLAQLGAQYSRTLIDRHLLTTGVEAMFERLGSDRLETGVGLRFRGAAYVQDEWTPLREPLLAVVPGVRVDGDTQFGAHFTPKVSVRFDPVDLLALRASYGWGFRAPSFRELYLYFENPGVGYVVAGNPALRPETSRSANLGGEVRPFPGLWLSANLFRNDLDDLIQAETADPGGGGGPILFQYVNVASAHTQGVEATARLHPVRGLTLEAGYALTDAVDESRSRPLAGRALHRGSFLVHYRHEPWDLEGLARGSISGRRPFYTDDDGDGVEARVDVPSFATVDVRFAKGLSVFGIGALTVFVQGENLLDAGDALFLPIPPRSFSGGVTFKY